MNVCVIPARGGSRRIPRKNIRDFCGKPMIAWSIEAAQRSGCFGRIVVSTDDEEIAEISKTWGAEVPFIRPPDLSDDFACTSSVVAHAVKELVRHKKELNAVCCLYATAPLVDPAKIKEGLELLWGVEDLRFVFTATQYHSPIQRVLKRCKSTGLAQMCWPENYITRSQDLELTFHDAGQFYWGRPQAWLKNVNLFEDSMPLLLPRWTVQDIDTEEDWFHAELMRQTLSMTPH